MNRITEARKYVECYSDPNYKMGLARMDASTWLLEETPCRTSYLDVGTGRGEMLGIARNLGFENVLGTEVVPDLTGPDVYYSASINLPFSDNSFGVVSMFDVFEHLVPEDTIPTIKELDRVARNHLIVSAANFRSVHNGVDLHINIKSYEEWDDLIREHTSGDVKCFTHPRGCNSCFWRIDYGSDRT